MIFNVNDSSEKISYTIKTTTSGDGSCTANPSVVDYNGTSTITSTPNTNYRFTDLTVNGVSVGTVSPYTINNIVENQDVTATFVEKPKIIASAGANGTISPSGVTYIEYNGSQSYTITANDGYSLDKLIIDGAVVTSSASYTFTNVTDDHTIMATFKVMPIYSFTIPYQSNPGGITYGNMASGMTQGQRHKLLRSHAHHAVVKLDGSDINYWLYNNDLNYKATDKSCTIASEENSVLTGEDGDVMLVYDPIWWTVSGTAGGDMTIKFSWEAQEGWVSPHMYGDTICNYLCVGVFEGYIDSYDDTLRSINTEYTPTTYLSENIFYYKATNGRSEKANVELPMTRMLMEIFYLFEYGNRNSQAMVGNGVCSVSDVQSCNISWDATNAWSKGDKSGKESGVTCCGIHNPWGNMFEFLGEIRVNAGVPYFSVQGGYDHGNIENNPPSTWRTGAIGETSWDYLNDVTRDLYYPFYPKTVGASSTTYYCDYACCDSNGPYCVIVGGKYDYDEYCGLFCIDSDYGVNRSYNDLGARLQILI